VRRRLVLAIAGVAAAAVVLFAVPLGVVLQRTYRDDELLRLQRDTIATTRAVDLSRERGDRIELPRSGDALAVYDLRGRRIAGRGPATADAVVRAALRRGSPADLTASGRLLVAVPLLAGERVAGAVRAERSDSAVAADTRQAWLVLAAGAAALIALAVLAASILARRLVAPLDRLAAAAGRLGEGDFTSRAPSAGIAELDAVAAALDSTAARLDNLLARERAFSADASHQLRTPLSALRIELEARELRGDDVSAPLEQVDRLQQTIETLLAVARDTLGSGATTDLAALAGELEQRWRGPLARAGRPLHVAISTPERIASASPRVIGEAVNVLVENALRHGGGPVTITVREAGDALAVDVADAGRGFEGDPEAAFVRRSGNGHGIGLALARSLVQAEGGRLLVTRAAPEPVLTLLLPR
jgi:signal transduction histidine kinase